MHTDKIARAIRYTAFAKKNPNDALDVNFYLSAGEKVTQQQLDAYHAAAKRGAPTPEPALPAEGNAAPEPESEAPHADDANGSGTPDDAPANVIQLAPPSVSIAAAQQRLVESQVAFRTAGQRVRELRSALGAAVARWQQSIGAITTPEMNAREFIRSETQLRADRKAGIAPPRGVRRRHRSAIDATAAATNYGSGAGGGNSFRRVVRLDDGRWVRPVGVHDVGRR